MIQAQNIFANAAVDAPLPNAPPMGEPLSIEFYLAPQRTGFLAADPPILIRRAAILPSGKVEVELPAGVPLLEVLRRADGSIPVGRDGQNHLFFAQESPPCRKSADLDDDGGLGLADGLYLVSYLFLGGPAPAAPFERCGTDPTADGLTCDWYPPCR